MSLTLAQQERARQLIARGIPDRFEGMSDDDAMLVLMASGLSEEQAELALAINRGRVAEDGSEVLADGTVAQH